MEKNKGMINIKLGEWFREGEPAEEQSGRGPLGAFRFRDVPYIE